MGELHFLGTVRPCDWISCVHIPFPLCNCSTCGSMRIEQYNLSEKTNLWNAKFGSYLGGAKFLSKLSYLKLPRLRLVHLPVILSLSIFGRKMSIFCQILKFSNPKRHILVWFYVFSATACDNSLTALTCRQVSEKCTEQEIKPQKMLYFIHLPRCPS